MHSDLIAKQVFQNKIQAELASKWYFTIRILELTNMSLLELFHFLLATLFLCQVLEVFQSVVNSNDEEL